jgi:hypothetical protein
MVAPVLDQPLRDRIGIGRIGGRPIPETVALDCLLNLGRELLPYQHFGEIDRRGNQHEAGDRGRGRAGSRGATLEFAQQQERDPAAHGRADDHLRPAAERVENREAVLDPGCDRAIGEIAGRFAVPGVVEAHAGAPLLRGPGGKRLRLGATHVRLEPSEPKQPGCVARLRPHGDPARPGRGF